MVFSFNLPVNETNMTSKTNMDRGWRTFYIQLFNRWIFYLFYLIYSRVDGRMVRFIKYWYLLLYVRVTYALRASANLICITRTSKHFAPPIIFLCIPLLQTVRMIIKNIWQTIHRRATKGCLTVYCTYSLHTYSMK